MTYSSTVYDVCTFYWCKGVPFLWAEAESEAANVVLRK